MQPQKQNGTFYSVDELKKLGLKKYGSDVLISRNAVLYNPELLEIGSNVRIDDFTTISGRVVLGDYIHIAQFCGLYGGTEGIIMDDFSGLSSRVVIYATSNDYSGESLTNPTVPEKYKRTDKSRAVHLGKHVIVGATSVILPGVTIGEGSSVGALSMCSKSLESWGVYAGSPARRIKDRSQKLLELEKQLREEEEYLNEGQ
ncbi:MAG: acyltransferase [Lachnospiraceae bacterium]|nr:acyltransferase [Lachnospiraceae bacterium]